MTTRTDKPSSNEQANTGRDRRSVRCEAGTQRSARRTFFALLGDLGLQRVHLVLHSLHDAVTLARLALVRDEDDDDDEDQDPCNKESDVQGTARNSSDRQ